MSKSDMALIRLRLPGDLRFRDMAVRVVASGCRLLRPSPAAGLDPPEEGSSADELTQQVVSAVGEAFNNIAIHGFEGLEPGEVELELEADAAELVVRIRDDGKSYVFPDSIEPPSTGEGPDALVERGMGLFIIRSFMDRVRYESGTPNVLELRKSWRPKH